jgi:5-methylthioadenosine/S-adenosylhomocysteine deaminase
MKSLINVDCIISGSYVLPMDEKLTVIRNGAVAVKGRRIADVGNSDYIFGKYSAGTVIKEEGNVILPGLINTHTHAAMVYFRGIADDVPLSDWLNKHIWPAENNWLSPEFVSDAIELACLEMLKGGITTYNDMYFYEDAAARTAKRMGMRGVLGAGIIDFPSKSGATAKEYFANAESFIKDWKGDELITPCIAPHSLYACGPDSLRRARVMAEKYDIPLHIHLSETKWEAKEVMSRYNKRPVEHLEAIGFLGENVLAAHCVWVENKEIELLAKRRVGVSHCMESNLKLASGFAPVVSMLAAGVRVSFGTDGAASNNDLNILSEMSTTAKVHKALSNDTTVLDARTILSMATRWGAEALGLGDKVGSLEKGKMADIVTISLNKPHLTPMYDVYSHIVYAAMASDVETVMINGRLVVHKRKIQTAEESEILYKAREWLLKIKDLNGET